MKVELIYDRDCPNVEEARKALRDAFAKAGLKPGWKEWLRDAKESPAYVKRFGSPTILVEGKDAEEGGEGSCETGSCRLYFNERGERTRVPSAERIAGRLGGMVSPAAGGRGRRFLAVLPLVGIALLPKLVCPACWPVYAAVLGSLGIGFVNYTPWLFPATLVFAAVVLGLLFWKGKKCGDFRPLIGGTAAIGLILAGKFWVENPLLLYGGTALLICALIWGERRCRHGCQTQN